MRNAKAIAAPILLGALMILLAPADGAGAWPTSTFDFVPVDTAPEDTDEVTLVPDGAGGAVVLWNQRANETDTATDIWAQRYDADGNALWGSRVLVLAPTAAGGVTTFDACPDGAGGVAVVADVYDQTAGAIRTYAQRLDAAGNPLWGGAGVAAVSSPTGFNMNDARIAATGDGTFVVVWRDARNYGTTNYDIQAQRFSGAGAPLWGSSGLEVCAQSGAQRTPDLVGDGAGGVFIAWQDYRDGNSYRIFGQHVLADGTVDPRWGTGGSFLDTSAQGAYEPQLVTGGPLGGFLLAFAANTSGGLYVYVTRFTDMGDYFWRVSMSGQDPQSQNDHTIIPDGEGGAFVAWIDGRSDGWTGYDVYVQHVGANGALLFSDAGVLAGPGNGDQNLPALALDGVGGVFVAWSDDRAPNDDIYAQRLASDGSRRWSYYGRPLAQVLGYDRRVAICADGRGGMIGAWQGLPYGYQYDALAGRLGPHGYPGDATPTLTAVADLPADQGGMVRLDWDASYLDSPDPDIVDDYLVWRRAGGAKQAFAAPSPQESDALAAATGLSAEIAAAQLAAGWSYVGSVTAYQFAAYSLEAPTYADSTGAGEDPTEFKVMARDGSTRYWESDVLSGHSVDNLSPGAPLALTGEVVGADGVLDWSPAGVDDEDLQVYEVHRSTTAGFTPGAGTLVGTTADTSYVDTDLGGSTWHYVVAGRDVHGNVGEPSNEVALSGVSAVGDGVPAAFAVRGASPNPFNPRTEIRFVLPAGAATTVDLYDARGRWLRRLHEGELGRGPHAVAWDGRDRAGRAVPSGTYLALVRSGTHRGAVKLTLAK